MPEEKALYQQTEKLSRRIEAILFVAGESVTVKKLGEMLGAQKQELEDALRCLNDSLTSGGLRLLRKDDLAALVTAPDTAKDIETFFKSEVIGDLSRAAMETLTVVAYHHPVSRTEIDYIRGVNSSFTLRNLVMRGLVERTPDKRDARSYLYRPTIELMKFLGIVSFQELPEYARVRSELHKTLGEYTPSTEL